MVTPSHPLYGAQLRLKRTDKHITEAQELIQAFSNACKDKILSEHRDNPLAFFGCEPPPLPPTLPVVLSDIIHNMRAALDYIIFELARLDTGKPQDGTQFLIEDIKSDPAKPNRGFDGRKAKHLKGLSPKHLGMVEALQPYNGVEWTKSLRNISNPDKHRHLTVLVREGPFFITFPNDIDPRTQPAALTSETLNVDASYAVYISPPDPRQPALVPLLRSLQAEICGAIELFAPEFPV